MSANAISNPAAPKAGLLKSLTRAAAVCLLLAVVLPSAPLLADEVDDVEAAVVKIASAQEALGFDFRADIWERELTPELGKAVRVQFFKGNDYRVCVAVAPKTGVKIAAHVLDTEGRPIESKIESTDGGWGATLHVKPQRTGVYVVVIRHAGGTPKPALCAMITGYK